jgi:hypothetical protein
LDTSIIFPNNKIVKKKIYLMELLQLLQDGIKAKEETPFNKFNLGVNEHLVSSLTCGTESQYDDSRRVIEKLFQIK